ncbi:hypothetical protein [Streptomyces sp. NPDC058701]|uniref:hypothetical protein n=1 Tax=Streptomyces sp. NPDC058701 TaxID=3346608 RepID=UPI003656E7A0
MRSSPARQPLQNIGRCKNPPEYTGLRRLAIIKGLLAVPDGDHRELRSIVGDWVLVFELRLTQDEMLRADRTAVRLWEFLGDLIEERRTKPREDLVSALVRPGQPDVFSPPDLLNLLASLYNAGFETTMNLFANGLRALFTHPEQADAVRRDPPVACSATEELLRFDEPIQMSFRGLAARRVGPECPLSRARWSSR